MSSKGDRPVLIIDALNLFMRHFIANPTMSSLGHHAGGIVGFLKAVRLLADRTDPSDVIVIWEGGGSSRRRNMYSGYKAKRKPQRLNRFYGDDIPDTSQNRDTQITRLVELIRQAPINQIYVSDCEADDVIGYLAKYKLKDRKCVIVSSDKDFYQLLSDRVTQWSPGQKAFVTPSSVIEKFGIPPHNFCTARCFSGDSSDNISGIKGAGFRTLVKRFPEFAESDFTSVDDILNLAQQRTMDSKVKLYNSIIENADVVKRNWKLMYLGTSNLAASQIQKVDHLVDTFEPIRNKIGLMRILVREGLSTFDADSFFMSLNAVSKT